MSKMCRRTREHCGLFAITVIVFVSGCSVAPQKMGFDDLDTFVVDCSRKAEQLAFISSQRTTRGEQVNAGLENFFMPWRIVTNPDAYYMNATLNSTRHEWVRQQVLYELGRCP